MKLKTIVGAVLIVGFSSLLFLNFGQQVGGYMTFDEAAESGQTAHVVGTWDQHELTRYDRARNVFTFHMKDEDGQVRQVTYRSPKPANFEEAQKIVVEGHTTKGGFQAKHILVKCPSKYNNTKSLNGAADGRKG